MTVSESKEKKSLKDSDIKHIACETPPGFLDPITQQPMQDPMLSADGISYEKATLSPLEQQQFIPNHTLKKVYEEYSKLPPFSVRQHIQIFLTQELQIFNLQLNLHQLLATQCGVSLSAKNPGTVEKKPSTATINKTDHSHNLTDSRLLFLRGEQYYQCYNFSLALPLLLEAAQKNYLPAFSLLWQIYQGEKFFFKESTCASFIAQENQTKSEIYCNLIIHGINDCWNYTTKDPVVMHYLGECYNFGQGFYPNKQKALIWHEKSAQHNYGTALYELSRHYGPVDVKKAQTFLNRSAEKGCMFAMLASFAPNSPLEKRVFAAKHLNFLYYAVKDLLDNFTIYSTEKIKAQFDLLNLIAIDGHPLAENSLARWYVERESNPLKAIYWSYRAANKGQTDSKQRLTELLAQYPHYSTLIDPSTSQSDTSPTIPLEAKLEQDEEYESIPSALCAIMHQPITHPKTTESGHSYEANAITTWLERSYTDPMTGLPIKTPVLLDNSALSQVLATFKLRTLLPLQIARQNKQLSALQQEIQWREQQLQKPMKTADDTKPPATPSLIGEILSGSVAHFRKPFSPHKPPIQDTECTNSLPTASDSCEGSQP